MNDGLRGLLESQRFDYGCGPGNGDGFAQLLQTTVSGGNAGSEINQVRHRSRRGPGGGLMTSAGGGARGKPDLLNVSVILGRGHFHLLDR